MRKEFFDLGTFDSIEATLDEWVTSYNTEREHQSIGDVPPMKRFELAIDNSRAPLEVIDGDMAPEEPPLRSSRRVRRVVDQGGRITVLTFRYHVGRHLAGCSVDVENAEAFSTSVTTVCLWPLMPSGTSMTTTRNSKGGPKPPARLLQPRAPR
jgi:hypothetical protein